MPPPRRSGRTNSITTVSSSSTSDTRPTLADVRVAPRRRLRDGSVATTSSSISRGSSRSRSVTRGASTMPTRLVLRAPVAPLVDLDDSDSDLSGPSYGDDGDEYIPQDDTPPSPPPPPSTSLRAGSARLRAPTQLSSLPASTVAPPSITAVRPPPTPPSISHSEIIARLDAMPPFIPTSPPTAPSHPSNAPATRLAPFDSRRRSLEDENSAPASSSSSSDAEPPRRFTRQEKGKGRAVVTPIPVESSPDDDVQVLPAGDEGAGDESIQIIGVKRKVVEVNDDESDLTELDGPEEQVEKSALPHEELEKLESYSCPVCFSEPTNAVMTPCGHVFCSVCLSSSLLAAIGRDPNVQHYRPPARPNARGRGRGRNNARGAPPVRAAQPTQWSLETLQTNVTEHREHEFEQRMLSIGLSPEAWDLAREEEGEVKVKSVLKGLWQVDGGWVIEGECPVCRKGIPGGYASHALGMGGVIPLVPRVAEVVR